MTFSENLTKARKKKRWTQLQLAMRSGVSQQAISKLESGKSSPSEYTMRQIAAALRIPLTDLLDEAQKEPADDVGGLRDEIISRLQDLPDPALSQVSAFLDGLAAGQEIERAVQAVPDREPQPAE